ncbi:MAG: Fe-S cluster assembly protein SufD [Pyrinomonadaceae bacterium]
MILNTGKETIYGKQFRKSIEVADQPEWLKALRNQAFAHFTENGFPTVRDEEWKYTNVSAISNSKFEPAVFGVAPKLANVESALDESFENHIVIINGFFDRSLSSLDKLSDEITVKSFAEAFEDDSFKSGFGKFADYKFNGFVALNTAFIEQGVFIKVSKNAEIDSPINITFVTEENMISFPRILFVGETGSETELVEKYIGSAKTEYATDSVVEICLADNAKLKHTRIQTESHAAFHFGYTQADLKRNSVYDGTNINLGGKLARHDVNLNFNSEGAEAWVDGLYLLEDGQHNDTHSRIHHAVKNCVSHQNYKGILDGKSRAVFNGIVYVHEHANGTDAEQSNKNLLLSNEARIDTKPQLEIFNDDVKCAHGATVGQLEDEELFYLLSRGLNEVLARNLLTYGFAEEIINKIENSSIKKQLNEAILERLQAKIDTE